jgi:cysteinyl-tRNA synthetase
MYKFSRVKENAAGVEAARAEASGSSPARSEALAKLLASCGDVLAEALDASHGHEVTDQSVFRGHAAKYEEEYLQDMKALGVRPAHVLTRVTEYIPEIIAYIERIIANGYAYTTDGDVYFDTVSFQREHNYAKLAPNAVGTSAAEEGEGALATGVGKRHPNDFALWKSSKAGEPVWPSPWGGGRPGWHIECSAMAG